MRVRCRPLLLLALLSAAACSSAVAPAVNAIPPGDLRSHAVRPLPLNLRGITFDDISSTCKPAAAQAATLRALAMPTVRVVFDPTGPACYAAAVQAFDADAYVMGELIDSSAMKRFTRPQAAARAKQYVKALGTSVDLWEIGNEVNGEWLSTVKCSTHAECAAQARDVMGKVAAMYAAVTAAGYRPALTLYYQPPKTVTSGYDMIPWEQRYVPASMHAGLQYVFVSYYENDNDGIRPTPAQWRAIFTQLAKDFPNARVGFGEIGLDKPIAAATLSKGEDIFTYYQGLRFPTVAAYTRAGFWWNAAEDLVPATKWPAFFREVSRTL